MNKLRVLTSAEDRSVNFVETALTGFLESRFVRKSDDYFICYLSSQTGCNRGCTFCHLTATGQTSFEDSTRGDFMRQAAEVFRHYRFKETTPAKWVHFNFMARGEPLANKYLIDDGSYILSELGKMAESEDLPAKFNISTIMPSTFSKYELTDAFRFVHPTIYYSLYSTRESFRKKWMPGAMPVEEALAKLKRYQDFSKKDVKIHFPFIEGENDSLEDVSDMCDAVLMSGLRTDFNLVRYNPASPEQGRESPPEVLKARLHQIRNRFDGVVKEIPRVGFDVNASCGMFVE